MTACETVPYTGCSQFQFQSMSPQQESELGAQAYQQTLAKTKLSSDAAASEMVTRVGSRIAAVTGHPEYKWEYRLIQDDKQANAFALPGGKVAVYTGILPITRDENGLAAVLGHEIGHVIARHGSERVSQQMLVNTGLTGLETTMAALSRGNPATVQAVASLLGAGATVGLLLPWSRAQESEADHVGRPSFPRTLFEFQRRFSGDEECRRYLSESRWSNGYSCPRCNHCEAYELSSRALLKCKVCGCQTSATAGTVLHGSKMPLSIWF